MVPAMRYVPALMIKGVMFSMNHCAVPCAERIVALPGVTVTVANRVCDATDQSETACEPLSPSPSASNHPRADTLSEVDVVNSVPVT